MKYNIENRVFLSSRNISTSRSCSKLKNKMLRSFSIIDRAETFYKLKLSNSMKIHLVFHSHLLRKDSRNSLSEQIQQSSKSTETSKDKKFDLIDILNSRWHYERLQYQCSWVSEKFRDRNWYNTDDEKFNNAREIVNNYHQHHSNTSESINNALSSTRKIRTRFRNNKQSWEHD